MDEVVGVEEAELGELGLEGGDGGCEGGAGDGGEGAGDGFILGLGGGGALGGRIWVERLAFCSCLFWSCGCAFDVRAAEDACVDVAGLEAGGAWWLAVVFAFDL